MFLICKGGCRSRSARGGCRSILGGGIVILYRLFLIRWLRDLHPPLADRFSYEVFENNKDIIRLGSLPKPNVDVLPELANFKNPGVTCNLGVVRRLQVTPGFVCPLAVGAVCGTQVKNCVFFWPFWRFWGHFHDLERFFTKNSDFPGAAAPVFFWGGIPFSEHK